MLAKPGALLRVEGAAVFTLSLILYHSTGAHWWIFAALFLWPDIFMLGYVVSVRLGASLYNLVHTYFFPLALAGISVFAHKTTMLPFTLIWLAHIGLDRALGFGLKYSTFFKDTHLQRVN